MILIIKDIKEIDVQKCFFLFLINFNCLQYILWDQRAKVNLALWIELILGLNKIMVINQVQTLKWQNLAQIQTLLVKVSTNRIDPIIWQWT